MTGSALEVQDGTGSRRPLDDGAANWGFVEAGQYIFHCAEGLRLIIDDIELARQTDEFHWSPGFYAGQVEAELLRADGAPVALPGTHI